MISLPGYLCSHNLGLIFLTLSVQFQLVYKFWLFLESCAFLCESPKWQHPKALGEMSSNIAAWIRGAAACDEIENASAKEERTFDSFMIPGGVGFCGDALL